MTVLSWMTSCMFDVTILRGNSAHQASKASNLTSEHPILMTNDNNMFTFSFIVALSLSYSAYAFQNGGILQRSNNAGFSQSGNSASVRNMKSAALLESDEGSWSRMGWRFEPVLYLNRFHSVTLLCRWLLLKMPKPCRID